MAVFFFCSFGFVIPSGPLGVQKKVRCHHGGFCVLSSGVNFLSGEPISIPFPQIHGQAYSLAFLYKARSDSGPLHAAQASTSARMFGSD